MDGITTKDTEEILLSLSKHISNFDPGRLGAHGLSTTKAGITDTIGVALAGQKEPCTQILLSTPGVADSSGPSLIFGTNRRTSALDAALVNGTSCHALDFDDFSSILGGHQSAPLVAPLFALAEDRALTGRQIVDAYIVGLEVEHRFARAVHPHHYDKGWHPTSTIGIFGTVAAAAYAIGLPADKTATAMSIAASMASGLKANFGTMTKPLHIGHSVRNGLMAVFFAERGFGANTSVMEHHQGFLNVFNGPGLFNPTPLTEAWSDALSIDLPTLSLKQFPCCGSMHHAIFAMLELAQDEDINPARVRKIDIAIHARRLRHTNTPFPSSALQAKFSVQYAVARALLDRSVMLKDFEGDAFLQPEILRLLDVVTTKDLSDGGSELNGAWDAEIRVTLENGQHFVRRVENLVGRSGDNAMTLNELRTKFVQCAILAVSETQAALAFDALMDLEDQDNICDTISFLAADKT